METHGITDTSGYDRIVVPLDGSSLGETALPVAAAIARASKGSIHLARVHAPIVSEIDLGISAANFDEEIRRAEGDYVAKTARSLVEQTQIPTDARLLDEPVGQAIVEHVKKLGATLVVMSTHGRTGLSRMWLGSTTDWVVRFLPVPALVVRPPDEDTRRGISLEQVLIALDGSTRSEKIIPEAIRLGRLGAARFTLLRVVPTSVRELASYAVPTFPPVRDELHTRELMRHAKDYLDGVAERLRRDARVEVSTEVVASDRVADAILQRAGSGNVEVIALATSGRGASRLLVGSVADKVLRGFNGALLVMGPAAVRESESDEIVEEPESMAGSS